MLLSRRGEASRLTVAIILIVVVAVVSTLILTLKKKAAPQQADESQKEALKVPTKEPEAKPAAEPEKTAKRSRVEKPVLVAGQIAPDFELPRLTIKTNEEGKTVGEISTETVKLSSFRGKRPVFLIFSSYT